jgi:hypothetical protein
MTEQSKEELDFTETSSGSEECDGNIAGISGQNEPNSDYNAEDAVSYNDTDLAINGHNRNRLPKKNYAEIKEEMKNIKNPTRHMNISLMMTYVNSMLKKQSSTLNRE